MCEVFPRLGRQMEASSMHMVSYEPWTHQTGEGEPHDEGFSHTSDEPRSPVKDQIDPQERKQKHRKVKQDGPHQGGQSQETADGQASFPTRFIHEPIHGQNRQKKQEKKDGIVQNEVGVGHHVQVDCRQEPAPEPQPFPDPLPENSDQDTAHRIQDDLDSEHYEHPSTRQGEHDRKKGGVPGHPLHVRSPRHFDVTHGAMLTKPLRKAEVHPRVGLQCGVRVLHDLEKQYASKQKSCNKYDKPI